VNKLGAMMELERNAINLIQLGFEDSLLSKNDKRRIISSVCNIFSGIVLFFKAELIKRAPASLKDSIISKNYDLKNVGDELHAKSKGDLTIGFQGLEKRFNLLNLSIKDEIEDLKLLKKMRNSIVHKYPEYSMELLENSVLDAFLLLNEFNNKYSTLDPIILFGEQNYPLLIDDKKIYDSFKKDCISKWERIDFTPIISRVFPVEQEDDPDTTIHFFNSIKCPNCCSKLIVPLSHNFSQKTSINMKCLKCNKNFDFIDVIEEILERRYAYEIMKVGSKGGRIPLSICPSCTFGTFLEYESICIYCGNTKQGEYDPDYVNDLFTRNINDYSDDIF
jgi:hypothetical protein